MDRVPTARFIEMARCLGAACRQAGLSPPGFRAPPRLVGARRTLRRFGPRSALVSVRLAGRSEAEVANDMVDGVLAAACLSGPQAEQARRTLLLTLATGCPPQVPAGDGAPSRAA